MVNLTIDGRKISVKENTTIMEAARLNNIDIPKLCYLKMVDFSPCQQSNRFVSLPQWGKVDARRADG